MSTLLAVLGALGGVVLIFQFGKGVMLRLRRLYLTRLASEKDYSYDYVETGDRWIKSGKHVVSRRSCRLVARQHNLESIRVGFGPQSKAEIDVRVVKGDVSLKEIAPSPPGGDWLDFRLSFASPLRKGDKAEFVLETESRAKRGATLPSQKQWLSDRRVDNLTLRVVLSHGGYSTAKLRCLRSSGDILFEEVLPVDALNREARWATPLPKPGVIYSLAGVRHEPAE